MATAKKIPDNNYQVQLTLSPKEARYIQLLVGRCKASGLNNGLDIYTALREVNGFTPSDNGPMNFNDYANYSKLVRDWVENGE